jgi:antitoxin component YwqK of YwqJK toxin-antitoxin module
MNQTFIKIQNFLKLLFIVALSSILLTSCARAPVTCLASINLIDADGVSETISNDERLKNYDNVNFLSPQPYKKVLRVYKRNEKGMILACLTSYHPNGELKQYLELVNGRAYGEYGVWYDNGTQKVRARVIGGNGDFYDGVENTWLFDGICEAFSNEGCLEAEIPYIKGKREGIARYYHKSGRIWKEIPLCDDRINGLFQVYLDDGSLFEETNYVDGKREGNALRYWKDGSLAFKELYECDRLMEGSYIGIDGLPVSEIVCGNGFKAIFDKTGVQEFQEYRAGVQEGLVKVLGKGGVITKTYGMKDGLKNGEEIEFYPNTNQPKFSIGWVEGKIQGVTKTWYASGVQESQREMAGNKRSGVLTAWYANGKLMLLENYDQDALVKGEYYKMGDQFSISRVLCGDGTATLFDSNGVFMRKVKYRQGKPEW